MKISNEIQSLKSWLATANDETEKYKYLFKDSQACKGK